MTGQDKARETADRIRAENEANKAQEEKNLAEVKSELATIAANKPLADLYNESASVGVENLGGGVWPFLKIYAAGKSNTVLADGKRPTDGSFIYTPTKQQIDEPVVRILTVSKKFKSYGPPDKQGNQKIVKTQILGGLLIDGIQPKPFLFLVSGTRLPELWKFGKEIQQYKNHKPFRIPMFTLTVNLKSESENNEEYGGYTWMLRMTIDKDPKTDVPSLIQDVEEFSFVKNSIPKLEMLIDSFIEQYEIKDDVTDDGSVDVEAKDVPDSEPINGEKVAPEDIPF